MKNIYFQQCSLTLKVYIKNPLISKIKTSHSNIHLWRVLL